jgi:protein-S-isoprenylcysteine O-methyltransferase Ste14
MKETRADAVAYAVAVVILVVGGAVFRTPILNWLSGPAIVVAVVALLGGFLARREARRGEGDPDS